MTTSAKYLINEVLTCDQCFNGFNHTANEVILWLERCDEMARIEFAGQVIRSVIEKEYEENKAQASK